MSAAKREVRCACAHFEDGSAHASLCPIHADSDPCALVARITGKRREGTIRRGVCTNCGWHEPAAVKGDSARCDMRHDCSAPVAMIGSKGYIYCREHGTQRRGVERTRLMRPWELKLVQAGKPVPSYEPLPRAVALAGGVNAYLNRNLPGTHVNPEQGAVTGGDAL